MIFQLDSIFVTSLEAEKTAGPCEQPRFATQNRPSEKPQRKGLSPAPALVFLHSTSHPLRQSDRTLQNGANVHQALRIGLASSGAEGGRDEVARGEK